MFKLRSIKIPGSTGRWPVGVWRLAKHMLSGEPPESAREPRALPNPIRRVAHLRAGRLLWTGTVADSFAG